MKPGQGVLAPGAPGVDDQRQSIESPRRADRARGGGGGEQLRGGRPGLDPNRGLGGGVAGVPQAGSVARGVLGRRRQALQDRLERADGVVVLRSRLSAEMERHCPPGGNRRDQAADARLQDARSIAEVGGFAERRVDHRIERDHPAHHLAPRRARRRLERFGRGDGARQTRDDARGDRGEFDAEPPPGGAEVGQRQDDARAHDAQRDLDHARDGQDDHRLVVGPAGRTEHVACDHRGGEAGEARAIGGEVLQQPADEPAGRAPQGEAGQEADAVLREQRRDHHDRGAAAAVPIRRNEPLRSDAPSCGWQTSAAVVPAQEGSELKREGDVEGEADGGPEPHGKNNGAERARRQLRRKASVIGAGRRLRGGHSELPTSPHPPRDRISTATGVRIGSACTTNSAAGQKQEQELRSTAGERQRPALPDIAARAPSGRF